MQDNLRRCIAISIKLGTLKQLTFELDHVHRDFLNRILYFCI